jgi:hypothetical protein
VVRVQPGEPIPVTSPAREGQRDLELYVVFTEVEATRRALKTASELARGLCARLVLVAAQVVPWPLPLETPPVGCNFTESLLSQLAAEQAAAVTVKLYLCRDREATLRAALHPRSLVLIGSSKRWWSKKQFPALARLLKQDGHDVIVVFVTSKHPAHDASGQERPVLQEP